MKKLIFLLFSSSVCFVQAQFLDEYPKNQDFYEGGMVNFYKEAHEYLSSNKSKECAAEEIYQPRIIVTKDNNVKLVKDNDTAYIAKNKCAYNLAIEVIRNLKHWKPAEVKGGKVGAVTEFIFYPKDLLSKYKEGYNPNAFILPAQYPDGMKKFNEDFHDNFMALFFDYHINGDINLEFYISTEGKIINPRIYPVIDNRDFNVDFLRTLSRIKKTWKPALYSHIPIKQRIAFPMKFSTNFNER